MKPVALLLVGFLALATVCIGESPAQYPTNDYVDGGVLDQQYVEDFSEPRYKFNRRAFAPTNQFQEYGQSLTTGRAGQLSHVSIFGVGVEGEWTTLSLYTTEQGLPQHLIGSRTLMTGIWGSERWITFDFRSQQIHLDPGQVIALTMSGKFDWIASLWGDPYLRYEGGSIHRRNIKTITGEPPYNGGNWYLHNPTDGNDLLFKTYFIPIPEPASIAMAVAGVIGVALSRRANGMTRKQ